MGMQNQTLSAAGLTARKINMADLALSSDVGTPYSYYIFAGFGYLTYVTYNKRAFFTIAVQSDNTGGGQYYRPYMYFVAQQNHYPGASPGWSEQWGVNKIGAAAAGDFKGKFKSSSTYYDSLAENYSSGTYYFATYLQTSGGPATHNVNWNGYAMEFEQGI